jgi:hypothetical protein
MTDDVRADVTTFTVEGVYTIANRGTVVAGLLDGAAPLVAGAVLHCTAPVSIVHVEAVDFRGSVRDRRTHREMRRCSVLLSDPYPGVEKGMVFEVAAGE